MLFERYIILWKTIFLNLVIIKKGDNFESNVFYLKNILKNLIAHIKLKLLTILIRNLINYLINFIKV